jgi:competence protein ComEA
MVRRHPLLCLLILLIGISNPWAGSEALSRQLPGIDANTATEVELDAISGIGPALAARIVTERANGPFESLEDLQQRVRGVGPASLRRMQEAGLQVGAARLGGRAETIVGGREAAGRPSERRANASTLPSRAASVSARPKVSSVPGPARPSGP